MLGAFGFAGDARQASYFVYRIRTDKRKGTTDTNEYVQCCRENQCGYGFVSALVYGDGEYATAEESIARRVRLARGSTLPDGRGTEG